MDDDAAAINARMKELERERLMSADIDAASGEWLDMWGARYGVARNTGEADYNYRPRIKEVM